MATFTLPNSTPDRRERSSFADLAVNCAKRVGAIGVSLGVLALAAFFLITNHEKMALTLASAAVFLWELTMQAVSLGGSFWGAITVGYIAQAVAAWSLCVAMKLNGSQLEN